MRSAHNPQSCILGYFTIFQRIFRSPVTFSLTFQWEWCTGLWAMESQCCHVSMWAGCLWYVVHQKLSLFVILSTPHFWGFPIPSRARLFVGCGWASPGLMCEPCLVKLTFCCCLLFLLTVYVSFFYIHPSCYVRAVSAPPAPPPQSCPRCPTAPCLQTWQSTAFLFLSLTLHFPPFLCWAAPFWRILRYLEVWTKSEFQLLLGNGRRAHVCRGFKAPQQEKGSLRREGEFLSFCREERSSAAKAMHQPGTFGSPLSCPKINGFIFHLTYRNTVAF